MGASHPVCCRKPTYGPHEHSIIIAQVDSLFKNDWIIECGRSWGSHVVLAVKPHQYHTDDIKKCTWRMCVSYRGLNNVTKVYEYPIPRCDMAITIVEVDSSKMWIITGDTKQGYHPISVRECDIEKLVFFTPDNREYAFKVMPFGPVNTPTFYICMMKIFREEWDRLVLEITKGFASSGIKLGDETVSIVGTIIKVGNVILHSGTKSIIDDILI